MNKLVEALNVVALTEDLLGGLHRGQVGLWSRHWGFGVEFSSEKLVYAAP